MDVWDKIKELEARVAALEALLAKKPEPAKKLATKPDT